MPADTLRTALLRTVRHPGRELLRRWNWKTALLSALFRGAVPLAVGGWRAAALTVVYRSVMGTLQGALAQSFREVEPAAQRAAVILGLVPAILLGIEWVLYEAQGVPRFGASVTASASITADSTWLTVQAMRNGALLAGPEGGSLQADLGRIWPYSICGGKLPKA